MQNLNQLLLIPLTIWSGLEQSFLGAQFTKVIQQNSIKYLNKFFLLGFCFLYIERKIRRFDFNCIWYL
jgi:hypothetical protein